jgi:hypothetical protein
MANPPAATPTWQSFFRFNTTCLLYDVAPNLRDMIGPDKSVDTCMQVINYNPTVPLMIISPFNKVQILFGMKKVGGDLFSVPSYVLLSPHGTSCTPSRSIW